MGWSIKYPLGKNSTLSRTVSVVTGFTQSAASNVGSTIKGVDSTFRNVKNDINKGEIGKFTSNLSDSFYNIRKAPVTALQVATGKKSAGTEITRLAGSAYNQQTLGITSYLGQSSSYQEALTNKNVKKWTLDFSANLAGKDSAVFSSSRTGTISRADKNDIFEWFGKSAAIGGGVGLYQYLTTPQAGALASSEQGAILVESGPGLAPESSIVSSDIGLSSPSIANTSPLGLSNYLPSANTLTGGALAYGVLSGKTPPGAALSVLNPGISPDTSGFLDDILNPIFGGGGGQGSNFQVPSVISAPVRSVLPDLSDNQASVLSIALFAGIGYLIYRRLN